MASAPASGSLAPAFSAIYGVVNAVEEASRRSFGRVKRVARHRGTTPTSNVTRGSGWKKSETDWLAVCVSPVKLANGKPCIGKRMIGHKSGARRASSTIETEGEGDDGTDTSEKALHGVSIATT